MEYNPETCHFIRLVLFFCFFVYLFVCLLVCLFELMLNAPVNSFSVMLRAIPGTVPVVLGPGTSSQVKHSTTAHYPLLDKCCLFFKKL